MDVTRFRLWQWMLIGLFAGAAVGYAWTNLPNDLERTGDREQFRRFVRNNAGTVARGQPPLIRNIVVHEPERDPSNVLVYPVTFEAVQRLSPRQALAAALKPGPKPATPATPQYTSSGIYAPTPFDGNASIIDFLKNSKVSFTDRSGAGRLMPVYYGAAGGLLLIGILWPATIQMLIRAGLAKAPPPREKKAKVEHRTGEDVDDMIVKPTAKPVDGLALNKLNDAMEANLAATLTSGGPRAATAEAEEPVSVLMSGSGSRSASDPTERPAAPMTEQEKKDFAGQYYPVARVVKKDDDVKH